MFRIVAEFSSTCILILWIVCAHITHFYFTSRAQVRSSCTKTGEGGRMEEGRERAQARKIVSERLHERAGERVSE